MHCRDRVWVYFFFFSISPSICSSLWQEVPEQVEQHAARTQICPFKQENSKAMDMPCYYGYTGGRKPASIDPISYYSHTDSVADLQQSRGKTQIWDALMYRRHMYFQRFPLYKQVYSDENLVDSDSGTAL